MASVPFISRTPCANRTNSFANAFSQMGFRSGLCNSWRYLSCWPVATSVNAYDLFILGSGVTRSWYSRSSCVTCGGRWPLGLRRAWTWVGSVGQVLCVPAPLVLVPLVSAPLESVVWSFLVLAWCVCPLLSFQAPLIRKLPLAFLLLAFSPCLAA
jgi:hypothetical protein